MKILKGFLIGVLSTLIAVALFLLGISLNLKYTITDTVTVVMKDEIANTIFDNIENNTDMDKEEIITEINKVLDNNPTIKETVENYFDMAMDILNGKDVENIDLRNEVEKIINDNETVLNEYGITITEEDKNEILEFVSSEEFNDSFTETIEGVRKNVPKGILKIINLLNIVMSSTFKLGLISFIIVSLILVALLKKSFYKWLPNLFIPSIIIGAIFLAFTFLISSLFKNSEDISISFTSFESYGVTLVIIGIIAITLNIVLSKVLNKKKIVNE